MHDPDIHALISVQLREGVRTEAEALALGQQIVACPGLFLRGLMTHHGDLDKFLPIISAFKETFGQVPCPFTPPPPPPRCLGENGLTGKEVA